jgi:hypothetical protein
VPLPFSRVGDAAWGRYSGSSSLAEVVEQVVVGESAIQTSAVRHALIGLWTTVPGRYELMVERTSRQAARGTVPASPSSHDIHPRAVTVNTSPCRTSHELDP